MCDSAHLEIISCRTQFNIPISGSNFALGQNNLRELFGPFGFNPLQNIFLALVFDFLFHLLVNFGLIFLAFLLKHSLVQLDHIGEVSLSIRLLIIGIDVFLDCLKYYVDVCQFFLRLR